MLKTRGRLALAASVMTLSLMTLSGQAIVPQAFASEAPLSETGTSFSRSGLTSREIDQLVEKVMAKFQVPGIAVGIIKDGKVIHAKGYGVRNVNKGGKVDKQTLFSIASTGKSFTTAALALLVDEGKITWADKVTDYIPDFQLYDPWVTREFTIKDLLIHNSGMGLGAGDLMIFPSQNFSRTEIIKNLRHLKPVSSFRSEYAYDNLLYIVAGEVIAAVSGQSYEAFIERRILKPLGMKQCAANLIRLKDHQNVADPHAVSDGTPKPAERDVKLGRPVVFAAAGGLQCSVQSILKWHQMHLNKGKLPNGTQFLSEEQQQKMVTAQTIMPVKQIDKDWFGTSFSAYGLGWRLSDYNGYKKEQHGGGLLGMLTFNVMIPDLNLGLAVYTNQQAGFARPAIVNSILEAYTSDQKTDWISRFTQVKQEDIAEAAKSIPDLAAHSYKPTGDIKRYVGTYKDPWFGNVTISPSKAGLYFTSKRSIRLRGRMIPYKSDIFIVRWDDRSLNADAYVRFSTGYDGRPEDMTLKAVSPLTDFSFDFHDLNFTRLTSEGAER